MAPKFALFTKGSKLPLNKGFKNMFELLQSCDQPSNFVIMLLSMLGKHFRKQHFEIFFLISQKTGFDISYEFSSKETSHEILNTLFL